MSDDQFTQLSQDIQDIKRQSKSMNRQFIGLFKYMNKEFKAVREEIAEVKGSINVYANAVDAFAKRTEIYRHEKWHHQTAKAINIKLSA